MRCTARALKSSSSVGGGALRPRPAHGTVCATGLRKQLWQPWVVTLPNALIDSEARPRLGQPCHRRQTDTQVSGADLIAGERGRLGVGACPLHLVSCVFKRFEGERVRAESGECNALSTLAAETE